MPDDSADPVDHARTTRQHAGESMKAGVNAPGLIAVGLGVLASVIGLFSFANGTTTLGLIGVVVAVLLIGGGLGWLALMHRKVREREQNWLREHPEAPAEPPTS